MDILTKIMEDRARWEQEFGREATTIMLTDKDYVACILQFATEEGFPGDSGYDQKEDLIICMGMETKRTRQKWTTFS